MSTEPCKCRSQEPGGSFNGGPWSICEKCGGRYQARVDARSTIRERLEREEAFYKLSYMLRDTINHDAMVRAFITNGIQSNQPIISILCDCIDAMHRRHAMQQDEIKKFVNASDRAPLDRAAAMINSLQNGLLDGKAFVPVKGPYHVSIGPVTMAMDKAAREAGAVEFGVDPCTIYVPKLTFGGDPAYVPKLADKAEDAETGINHGPCGACGKPVISVPRTTPFMVKPVDCMANADGTRGKPLHKACTKGLVQIMPFVFTTTGNATRINTMDGEVSAREQAWLDEEEEMTEARQARVGATLMRATGQTMEGKTVNWAQAALTGHVKTELGDFREAVSGWNFVPKDGVREAACCYECSMFAAQLDVIVRMTSGGKLFVYEGSRVCWVTDINIEVQPISPAGAAQIQQLIDYADQLDTAQKAQAGFPPEPGPRPEQTVVGFIANPEPFCGCQSLLNGHDNDCPMRK